MGEKCNLVCYKLGVFKRMCIPTFSELKQYSLLYRYCVMDFHRNRAMNKKKKRMIKLAQEQ